MMWGYRALVAVVATAGLAMGTLPAAAAGSSEKDVQDPEPVLLLVHGYGNPDKEDCDETWGKAIDHFEAEGMDKDLIQTIGYYTKKDEGNEEDAKNNCNTNIGDFSNESGIDHIAERLAQHIASIDRPVNIVAHSMGGLITRVALLGSANRWTDKYDFPDGKLHNVDNVVTLDTPHQGISQASKHPSKNWRQMNYPESDFMRTLHSDKNKLNPNKGWAKGTDWSFVGSSEDTTVSYDSGIDQGNGADQKYGYQEHDDGGDVTHSGVRTLDSGNYNLIYWNDEEGGTGTDKGWSPLETAYNAATNDDQDGQP